MKKILILTILCLFVFSCRSIPDLDRKTEMNFFTDGFISDHYFQVYVQEETDLKKNATLVRQRENSYIKATNSLFSKIDTEIKKYIRNSYSERMTPEEIDRLFQTENFKAEYSFLLRKGQIVYKYFDENNSCILVYRISAYNLRDYIDTVFDEKDK